MKTLGEIIEITLSGGRPGYDELRYALCAMQALSSFDIGALGKLSDAEKENKKPFLSYSAEFQYSECFNRRKNALKQSPKKYLDWSNDPENPEYQKSREWSKLIFANAANVAGYMGDVAGIGCDPSTP